MIQGGDPEGTGRRDPGYKFKNETSPDLEFRQPGRLAYATLVQTRTDHNSSSPRSPILPEWWIHIFGQCDDAAVDW